MTNLTIKVTKEILRRSMHCSVFNKNEAPTNCAIALAVRDIFPNAFVTQTKIHPFAHSDCKENNDFGPFNIRLPQVASSFIRTFDSYVSNPHLRLGMPELQFEVEVCDEIIEQINIDEIKSLLIDHPTLILS